MPPESVLTGDIFRPADASKPESAGPNSQASSSLAISYYQPAAVAQKFQTSHDGRYQLLLDLTAIEKYVDNQFDYNKCRLAFKVDGEELLAKEFVREGGKAFHFEFDRGWAAGGHELAFEIVPLEPQTNQNRSLAVRLDSVTVRGPLAEQHFVRPKNYERFFTKDVPAALEECRDYARDLLGSFAREAFRRPVDGGTIERLVSLAESVTSLPKGTFEGGVAQAMVAVLASPRFRHRNGCR